MRFAILIGALCLLLSSAYAQWEPDVRLTTDPSWSYTPYNNARCAAAKPGVTPRL